MTLGRDSNGRDVDAFALEGPDTKREEETDTSTEGEERNKLAYCVTDVPPWYLCIILGIQHCLTAFGGIIAIPLILSGGLCLQYDGLTQSHLISTIFFVSGICTLLQVTFGVRLPILQGGTFTLLVPSLAMLSTPEWTCPAWTQNASLVNTSSPEFIEVWQSRMRALQGSIMVGSLFQVFVGFSGLIGFFMRFIGPLTIAPTISLIGLSLFDSAGTKAGHHWGISGMTTVLIILFSQYLRHIPVPFPTFSKEKRLHTTRVYIFQILPVLLGITLPWLICYILTICDVFPTEPNQYGHLARTDVKGDVVSRAPWITFPYPGQWGLPTVSLAGVVGILAGVISSMIESVGDYHACARLSGAPPPPKHAINRGIGIEGLGCLLAGAWGTGNGTTSYSENVGALGITKVGSRMVIIAGAVLLVAIGVFGKVAAIFTTIPSPVIGGMFLVMFGVIAAAGVSNLQAQSWNEGSWRGTKLTRKTPATRWRAETSTTFPLVSPLTCLRPPGCGTYRSALPVSPTPWTEQTPMPWSPSSGVDTNGLHRCLLQLLSELCTLAACSSAPSELTQNASEAALFAFPLLKTRVSTVKTIFGEKLT
uniref:Solute carrier family 23 member 4 n=1 Tax=Gasterosteus aculeatus aculeatus TaxID=481459 RepID=A0AAQ4NRD8_GASAC